MDNDSHEVQQVTSGRLRGIHLNILSDEDAGKISAIVIGTVNEVSDAALGLPTMSGTECLTCGAKNPKECDGHFGLIEFPCTIINPYYMSEVAQFLNKICPSCKQVRQSKQKKADSTLTQQAKSCKYCSGKSGKGYPKVKFRVSSKDVFAKTAIIADVSETVMNKSCSTGLASDYWDFIPKDSTQDQSATPSNRRVLFPSQVYSILKDVLPETLKKYFKRKNSVLLNSLLVTPNSHRVREFGSRITVDETTKMYRKLVDFRGTPNEFSVRVLDRFKVSKIRSEKLSTLEKIYEKQSPNDSASSSSGLKNIKELLLGKRTDNSFRAVVVGDPRIKVNEIGLPIQIADNMLISDHISKRNWDKLEASCDFMLYKAGRFTVVRKGQKVHIFSKDMLQIGDSVRRPLVDGDILLINRPPSIHQHSLLALSVKILPINSVVSINPLICSPLQGDFDGDCLHGYVPQSVNTRVELNELVSLSKQTINGQSGRNLLSLGQDSLTAAYLVLEDSVTLNKAEMQQLQMFCSCTPLLPAILKSASERSFWTGKQLFSLLWPADFEFNDASNAICIKKGELVTSSCGSSWLRDSNENLFQCLIRHYGDRVLDFLNSGQEVLCEWLSARGLSVSLSDLYLSSDHHSRKNLLDEMYYGLQEAEKLSDISLLMVDHYKDFLIENSEESEKMENFVKEHISIAPHTKLELFQASVSASKSVFFHIQNLVYEYCGNDNSFITMLKAGSKGNLQKLVQHSMCLGLQHTLAPLSFSIPRHLSCTSWNNEKGHSDVPKPLYTEEISDSYVPCSIVNSSFLDGLNPMQAFMHSLTSRDSSFSGNADVSGTLSRRLMFFMRDLVIGYDGTVRNCYGNQVVQFSYCNEDIANSPSDAVMGGHPVGSLAACAISEAAYSALDQPVSALEPSPLLALKRVLECGVKSARCKSASLFLSRGLAKRANGFEYGALEIKNYLESLFFSEIVSEVRICFSKLINGKTSVSPWACHFYVQKEVAKKRRLKLQSVIDALYKNSIISGAKLKINLPKLQITSKLCSEADVDKPPDMICISAELTVSHEESSDVDILRDIVIPVLLKTVIKGYPEFKKVDILWKGAPGRPKFSRHPLGELFLKVHMSKYCDETKFWSILMDKCLQIRNIIDWERSHPDDINDYSAAFGINSAWQCFINNLHSSISDIGKKILSQHLVISANCLSTTGEFVPLNPRGLANQRKEANIHSPFNQACFSNPSDCFVKAAKMEQIDGLQGSLEALSWGLTPSIGTGSRFDIIYSGKGHEPAKPMDVFDLMRTHVGRAKSNDAGNLPMKPVGSFHFNTKQYKSLRERLASHHFSALRIKKISEILKRILKEYPTDCELRGEDKSTALTALQFHPRCPDKIGTGVMDIKVGLHPDHQETCFILTRTDGTEEDFSYRKCIIHALEIVDPQMAKTYRSKWNNMASTPGATKLRK